MLADRYILQLQHIPLLSKSLLPEQTGIYYIVDDQLIVWYIGKAKNLRNRWLGESHHRLSQLKKQRKQKYTIYYENKKINRINVYFKPFYCQDLRKTSHTGIFRTNKFGKFKDSEYKEIYLVTTVDKAFWLLLEQYISDFVKIKLDEDEGYVEKVYVSPRKYLVPAKLKIVLNSKWKAEIPFGNKGNCAYLKVRDIIASRLESSEISRLKFSFESESF